MKKTVLTLISFVAIFSGCVEQPNPSVVTVNEKCGTDTLKIINIKGQKQADGFMKTQITGMNSADHYQKLEYKIIWLDRDGFVIKSILSKWRETPADAKQEFYITNISPNTKASDFRLYIRQNEKETLCVEQQDIY